MSLFCILQLPFFLHILILCIILLIEKLNQLNRKVVDRQDVAKNFGRGWYTWYFRKNFINMPETSKLLLYCVHFQYF